MALSDFTKFGQESLIAVSNSRSNSSPQSLVFTGDTQGSIGSQIKASVLDSSLTDSPTEGRVEAASFADGIYPHFGFVARFQDLNNFYYGVFNDEFDGNGTIGKFVSGAQTVILPTSNTYFTDGRWQTDGAFEIFLDSNGDLTLRLTSPNGNTVEATDSPPELTGGGGLGLIQGGNGGSGFTTLIDDGLEQRTSTTAYFDDVEVNY